MFSRCKIISLLCGLDYLKPFPKSQYVFPVWTLITPANTHIKGQIGCEQLSEEINLQFTKFIYHSSFFYVRYESKRITTVYFHPFKLLLNMYLIECLFLANFPCKTKPRAQHMVCPLVLTSVVLAGILSLADESDSSDELLLFRAVKYRNVHLGCLHRSALSEWGGVEDSEKVMERCFLLLVI